MVHLILSAQRLSSGIIVELGWVLKGIVSFHFGFMAVFDRVWVGCAVFFVLGCVDLASSVFWRVSFSLPNGK